MVNDSKDLGFVASGEPIGLGNKGNFEPKLDPEIQKILDEWLKEKAEKPHLDPDAAIKYLTNPEKFAKEHFGVKDSFHGPNVGGAPETALTVMNDGTYIRQWVDSGGRSRIEAGQLTEEETKLSASQIEKKFEAFDRKIEQIMKDHPLSAGDPGIGGGGDHKINPKIPLDPELQKLFDELMKKSRPGNALGENPEIKYILNPAEFAKEHGGVKDAFHGPNVGGASETAMTVMEDGTYVRQWVDSGGRSRIEVGKVSEQEKRLTAEQLEKKFEGFERKIAEVMKDHPIAWEAPTFTVPKDGKPHYITPEIERILQGKSTLVPPEGEGIAQQGQHREGKSSEIAKQIEAALHGAGIGSLQDPGIGPDKKDHKSLAEIASAIGEKLGAQKAVDVVEGAMVKAHNEVISKDMPTSKIMLS